MSSGVLLALVEAGSLMGRALTALSQAVVGELVCWGDGAAGVARVAWRSSPAPASVPCRLTHQVEALVRQEWGPSFMEFGYS